MVTALDDKTDLEKLAPPGPPSPDPGGGALLIQGNPAAPAFGEIGVTGVRIFSGVVNEEYLPELVGQKAIKIYRTMQDDSIVNAVLTAITLILRAVDWRIEPAENSGAKGDAEAEFVESLLKDMSHTWEDTVSEILSMLAYGWSYHEIVLKRRVGPDETDGSRRSNFTDGRIGIRKLPVRSQDSLFRWEMQEDGGVAGMWQQSPMGGQQLLIPIERALLFRTTSRKNSPQGVSILRAAYRPWYIKRGVEDMEAIGIERELAGLPVVSIPKKYLAADASPADKAIAIAAQTIARDLKFNQQGGVVIPSDHYPNKDGSPSTVAMMEVKLLSTSGRRAIETNPIVSRYNKDIARAALADFLTLGDDKGSYALSKNKSELFLRACETYLNEIAAVVNMYLIPRMLAYNGIPHQLKPVAKPGRVSPVDLAEIGAYLQALAAAGAPLFPNQDLSDFLADIAGMPEPPDDVGLMATPGQKPGFGQIDPNTGEPVQPAIDPETGMLQHEADRQAARDDQFEREAGSQQQQDDTSNFFSDNQGPNAAKRRRLRKRRGSGPHPFEKAGAQTLYVSRPVLNGEDIRDWAKAQGLKSTLPADDMHVTLAFSRAPVDWSKIVPDTGTLTVHGDDRSVDYFGPDHDAMVLTLQSDALAARHDELNAAGCRWDWPSFEPHVSISYDTKGIGDVEPYAGPIVLGPEVFKPVKANWGAKISEVPVGKFNPNHDQGGRFTYSTGVKATGIEDVKKLRKEWEKESPFKTAEDLTANSGANQERFARVGGQTAIKTGTEFVNPGPKSTSRLIEKKRWRAAVYAATIEKIARGKDPATITDAVRGGFKVDNPEDADKVVAELAKHYQLADEGWAMTDSGYFDRKVIARLPDKQLAEVQFWHPEMLHAKEVAGGHQLYEAQQALEKANTRHPLIGEVKNAQRALYAGARTRMGASWQAVHMAAL